MPDGVEQRGRGHHLGRRHGAGSLSIEEGIEHSLTWVPPLVGDQVGDVGDVPAEGSAGLLNVGVCC